jgi:cellulose synthase/poly-beta-1,6-N-acetylglucosamine synthase-like glycosyltransferase
MRNSGDAETPFVSIVVPMYNEEKTVGECIKALLNQSYPSEQYEIIVVSDGSNDNSEEVVRNILKSENKFDIKLIRQESQGAAAARNFGVKFSQWPILLFIDADCIADYRWIEEMIKPFLRYNVTGVQGAYKTKQKKIVAQLTQIEFEERFRKLQQREYVDFVGSFSAAYKREVFEKFNGFNTKFVMNEDVDLAYRISSDGYRLYFNPEAIVYHMHPDSLSIYIKVKFWRGFWRTILYRNFRNKAIKDSYTPANLKIQVLLIFPIVLIALCSLTIQDLLILDVWLIIISIASMTGFIWSAMKKSIATGLFSIIFLWGRAFAIASGILFAIVSLFLKDNFLNFDYKKNRVGK